jgi:hypothetical protein
LAGAAAGAASCSSGAGGGARQPARRAEQARAAAFYLARNRGTHPGSGAAHRARAGGRAACRRGAHAPAGARSGGAARVSARPRNKALSSTPLKSSLAAPPAASRTRTATRRTACRPFCAENGVRSGGAGMASRRWAQTPGRHKQACAHQGPDGPSAQLSLTQHPSPLALCPPPCSSQRSCQPRAPPPARRRARLRRPPRRCAARRAPAGAHPPAATSRAITRHCAARARRCGTHPNSRCLSFALACQAAASAAPAGAYVAVNRYRVVDPAMAAQFEAEQAARAAAAAAAPGHVAYALAPLPPFPGAPPAPEYATTVTFASKEAYEAWMNTPQRRRSHLPQGVWQARAARTRSHACIPCALLTCQFVRYSTARPTSSACPRSSAPS